MKMQCPEGMSSVSWHGVNFAVDENGQIDVPEEAAAELTSHGLVMLSDDPVVADVQMEEMRPRRKR
jgi:hypothetical protein